MVTHQLQVRCSRADQWKFADQRPTFYHWATQPTGYDNAPIFSARSVSARRCTRVRFRAMRFAHGNVPLCIFARKRFARKKSARYRTPQMLITGDKLSRQVTDELTAFVFLVFFTENSSHGITVFKEYYWMHSCFAIYRWLFHLSWFGIVLCWW